LNGLMELQRWGLCCFSSIFAVLALRKPAGPIAVDASFVFEGPFSSGLCHGYIFLSEKTTKVFCDFIEKILLKNFSFDFKKERLRFTHF
jgi:hypothetical protein